MILADTDVLIDYLIGVEPAREQVRSYIQSDSLQTTALTCFELLSGANEDAMGDKTREFIRAVPVLPLDRESAASAAMVRQTLKKAGLPIGMADSLIAGIALANNLPVLTRNHRHFGRIDGLRVIAIGTQ